MRYIVEPIDQTDDYLPLFTEETSDTAADYRAQCQPAAAHMRRGGARYFCDESTSADAESKSAGSAVADDDVCRSEADMDCYSDDDNETRPINDKKTGKFYIYVWSVEQ